MNADCTACMVASITHDCVYAVCIGVAVHVAVHVAVYVAVFVAVSAAVDTWLIGVLVDHSDGVPFPTKVEHPHA